MPLSSVKLLGWPVTQRNTHLRVYDNTMLSSQGRMERGVGVHSFPGSLAAHLLSAAEKLAPRFSQCLISSPDPVTSGSVRRAKDGKPLTTLSF